MKGQIGAVLKHLQDFGSITSMQAIQTYGATRLSSIIYDLRKAGYQIETDIQQGKTRFGTSTQYAIYRLKKEE